MDLSCGAWSRQAPVQCGCQSIDAATRSNPSVKVRGSDEHLRYGWRGSSRLICGHSGQREGIVTAKKDCRWELVTFEVPEAAAARVLRNTPDYMGGTNLISTSDNRPFS